MAGLPSVPACDWNPEIDGPRFHMEQVEESMRYAGVTKEDSEMSRSGLAYARVDGFAATPVANRAANREAIRLVTDLFADATGMLGGPIFGMPNDMDASGDAFSGLLIALDGMPPIPIRKAAEDAQAATGRVSVLRVVPRTA
jgi:hypothetical protein